MAPLLPDFKGGIKVMRNIYKRRFFFFFLLSFGLLVHPQIVSAKTYVFVSFSQNDSSLQAYFKEAQRDGATLVMRGLLEDSFTATQKKTESLKISFEIDPTLFEKYGVTRVPTIVRDEGDRIQKIVGHIPLKSVLEAFAEQ